MSYKPEVIADSSGKWCANAHRFATHDEAMRYVRDWAYRWTLVREVRVVECDDLITSVYTADHILKEVPKEQA